MRGAIFASGRVRHTRDRSPHGRARHILDLVRVSFSGSSTVWTSPPASSITASRQGSTARPSRRTRTDFADQDLRRRRRHPSPRLEDTRPSRSSGPQALRGRDRPDNQAAVDGSGLDGLPGRARAGDGNWLYASVPPREHRATWCSSSRTASACKLFNEEAVVERKPDRQAADAFGSAPNCQFATSPSSPPMPSMGLDAPRGWPDFRRGPVVLLSDTSLRARRDRRGPTDLHVATVATRSPWCGSSIPTSLDLGVPTVTRFEHLRRRRHPGRRDQGPAASRPGGGRQARFFLQPTVRDAASSWSRRARERINPAQPAHPQIPAARTSSRDLRADDVEGTASRRQVTRSTNRPPIPHRQPAATSVAT